jgi:hypothetical protein
LNGNLAKIYLKMINRLLITLVLSLILTFGIVMLLTLFEVFNLKNLVYFNLGKNEKILILEIKRIKVEQNLAFSWR